MLCKNCGTMNNDGVTVCTNCGMALVEEVQQPMNQPMYQQPAVQQMYQQPVTQQMYQQPVMQTGDPAMMMYMEKQRKIDECNSRIQQLEHSKNMKKMIDAIITAVIFLIMAFVFFQDVLPGLQYITDDSDTAKQERMIKDGISVLNGEETMEEKFESGLVKLGVLFVVGLICNIPLAQGIRSDEKEIKTLKKQKKMLNQMGMPNNMVQ